MDGVHDLGGMDGFGALPPDEPDDSDAFDAFDAEWHGLVRALQTAGIGQELFTIDAFRHAIERQRPAFYLTATYHERWLAALERLTAEAGAVDPAELAALAAAAERGDGGGGPGTEGQSVDHPVGDHDPEDGDERLAEIREGTREAAQVERPRQDPAFAVGDRVVVRRQHPSGHTRCPRYVRGCPGRVAAHRGTHRLPDASAHGEDRGEPLYNVTFDAADVWGTERADADVLRLDLWEGYLRPAEGEEGDAP